MRNLSLTVSLANLPDARLARLARDLQRDLSRAGVQTQAVEAPSAPGERGEPITLGVLTLAFVTGGTVKAAIECFKTYLSREHALTINLTRPDGIQVEVNARNVDAADVRGALEAMTSANLK
jgi:hypothetical protein